jgi:hypothetical protein
VCAQHKVIGSILDQSQVSKMRKASKASKSVLNPETRHARWFLTGVVTSAVWTAVGCVLAFINGDSVRSFLRIAINYQGPFLILLGTWLLLMIRSKSFCAAVSNITRERSVKLGIVGNRSLRVLLISLITALGIANGISLGFDGRGLVFAFLWLSYFSVELATGFVTLHTLEILVLVRSLQYKKIKLSHYAPARTPELRSVVTYFSTFILLVAIGEAFSLLGTFKGHWTGPPEYVNAFRWFWPLMYVPMCSFMLIYPHLVIHKLIRKEKERTLSTYQEELEEHLSRPEKQSTLTQIERMSNLAQLVDRITDSPDYVFDFGIALRTVLPLALNLLTLLVKAPSVSG